ncbi:ankyrin repeat domain-containing protein [Endozoicomonas sp. YOMI1]|uniref:ankyrin repeat domain-containing protein n=1 Tax=Endozoicomonas sp. YOMI1 TaxID=2828739 RepID=UPI0021477952|nr:ankyrin repeat domain-containing protein [Endozoicomonas sp. YOMI1]
MNAISPSPIPTDTSGSFSGDECAICKEDFHGRNVAPVVVKTKCGHRFDLDCISTWFCSEFGKRMICAYCRQAALPLVREAGACIYEDTPFCEALPLHACRTGDSGKLNELLRLDPSIARKTFRSAVTGQQINLLFIAAQNNNIDCLEALIAAGADLNAAMTTDGSTPLHIAAQNNNTDCVKALIAAGADLNVAVTTDGGTPLFSAAESNNIDCLKALIAAGADLNAALTTDGATALFIAAQNNNTDCLQALIVAGADLNAARTTDGATPLSIATERNNTDCLQALNAARAGKEKS